MRIACLLVLCILFFPSPTLAVADALLAQGPMQSDVEPSNLRSDARPRDLLGDPDLIQRGKSSSSASSSSSSNTANSGDPSSSSNPSQSSAAAPSSTPPHVSKHIQVPMPILSTGCNLLTDTVSPNAMQLAHLLGLMPSFKRLEQLRSSPPGSLEQRVELLELREHIGETMRHSALDISYSLSEIWDEQSLYNEELGSFSRERDKRVATTNAIAFGTNGLLWAAAEALTIPTYSHPRYSISSGVTGILAGIIPSFASAWTLKEVNGKKHAARANPNMLAKLFNRPTSHQIDYPESVWRFLNAPPAEFMVIKSRKDLIIDRWISDKNISLQGRESRQEIDVLTGTETECQITISLLTDRLSMLGQLASEIFKMNRLLLELEMVLAGDKHMTFSDANK